MSFWEWLWTVIWFVGLFLFTLLTAIVTVQGARDLRFLLRKIRDEQARGE